MSEKIRSWFREHPFMRFAHDPHVFWIQVFATRRDGSWRDEHWPFRLTIMTIYRIGSKIRDFKYWLMYRFIPRHRYHIVRTNLEPRYYDIDVIMLHSNMELLRRYVEDECGGADKLQEKIDWMANEKEQLASGIDEEHVKMEQEAIDIYTWWTTRREQNWEKLEKQAESLYGGEIHWKSVEGGLFTMEQEEAANPICSKEEHFAYREKLNKDDQDMLHRLIDIRMSLWT